MSVNEGDPALPPANADSGKLVFDPDMEEIVNGFVVECEEFLEKLNQDLLRLESDPVNPDGINSVFRALHTMKGNSLALGLDKLNTLVHRTEDVIRKARDGELRLSPQALDPVFSSVDLISALVQDVKIRRTSSQDLEPTIARLKSVLEANAPPAKLQIADDMQEIVDGFVVESEELMGQLDQDLLALESTPGGADLIGSVFRCLHTLKGNSRALELKILEEFVHCTEDVIRKVRDGKMQLRPEGMDVVLRAADMIKMLLQDVRKRVISTVDLSAIKAELLLVFEEKYEELAAQRPKQPSSAPVAAPQPGKQASATIRVDLGKLDVLFNITGELVLNKNRLVNLVQRIEQGARLDDIEESLNELNAHTNILVSDLQSSVMSTRMQPIGKVFSKYPRVVRDLSRDLGKDIDLVISGEDTEIDNKIIEEISDPLIHLVRNCCDHGIEMPDDRRANGKDPKGRVDLRAYQEGNFVVIEIRDDGKGLDPDVLKRKAVTKNLITQEQADRMLKGEILNLIFAPGFSTAEKVTAVSGRGVGMDVVKTNVSRLNGIIELDSEKGQGCTVKIKLPLTLAVMNALEVEVGCERYLIPQESVVEITRITRDSLPSMVDNGRFLFRNEFWNPYLDLREVLGARGDEREPQRPWYIVIIGAAERRMGILVDNVVQQHEVVVKPLGTYMGHFPLPQINGVTIMGDGTVEVILNHNYLLSLAAGTGQGVVE